MFISYMWTTLNTHLNECHKIVSLLVYVSNSYISYKVYYLIRICLTQILELILQYSLYFVLLVIFPQQLPLLCKQILALPQFKSPFNIPLQIPKRCTRFPFFGDDISPAGMQWRGEMGQSSFPKLLICYHGRNTGCLDIFVTWDA